MGESSFDVQIYKMYITSVYRIFSLLHQPLPASKNTKIPIMAIPEMSPGDAEGEMWRRAGEWLKSLGIGVCLFAYQPSSYEIHPTSRQ